MDSLPESSSNKALFVKLSALKELGSHVGMWGPLRSIAEKVCNQREGAPELNAFPVPLEAVAMRLIDPEAPAPAKQACAMILDYYVPGWRDENPQIAGLTVRRDDSETKRWRSAVMRRDRCCQNCGATEHLHAHHIVAWADAPALRLVVDNGVALCGPCHAGQHSNLSFWFITGGKRKSGGP